MGKRKSSGLFETIVKSVLGTGTTVHRDRDWLGHSRTVVKHHDTGKTKTYTHGTGFFGNVTKTKTKENGRVVERGKIRKTFWTGTPIESAERTDGTTVERTYGQGFFEDKMKTQVYGPDGHEVGSGQTKPRFLGGTNTTHVRYQDCRNCGNSVASTDGRFFCTCGRRWGRH